MANRFELPKDPGLAAKIIENEHAKNLAEMGKIGAWFGSRDNAIIYLAAAILVLAIIVAGGVSIGEPSVRAEVVKTLLTIATLAIGVMAGAGVGGRRRQDHE